MYWLWIIGGLVYAVCIVIMLQVFGVGARDDAVQIYKKERK